MTTPLQTLIERRQALQARSRVQRTQLAADLGAAHLRMGQGAGLARVVLKAAGLASTLMALRRRHRGRWLASGLRLLPLAWGLWRVVRAARGARR